MSLHVLVISSNSIGADQLREDLARAGADVTQVRPDRLAEQTVDLRLPHVIMLDLRDPAVETSDLRAAIRGSRRLSQVPVLAVVSEQRLAPLESRDDIADFVTAPYRHAELRARLWRIAARANGAPSVNAIKTGDLTLDPDNYDVAVRGVPVDLTLKEYELLKYLVTRPGRVFTRDQLLSSVWGYDYVGGTRTVDVHIRRLRAKLGAVGETSIDTVRGVGYAFRPPRDTA
jgi:DNA-binding response OmpR family regulator